MTAITPELQQNWTMISPFLTITNESEYDAAIERLNTLLSRSGK
jgi:HTH-type transcriptional regulator / antitoxin HigA